MDTTSYRALLVGGGVRCGKSAFALEIANQLGPRRVFIATAQAFDDEMAERIRAHKLERGAPWKTLEEPLELPDALRSATAQADVVVIDCLTLWLSNLLLRDDSDGAVLQQIEALADVVRARSCHVIMVTNEVGMGLVPESALGRRFRDCAGRAHQRLAKECSEVYAAVLGCILRLRPGPVELNGGHHS